MPSLTKKLENSIVFSFNHNKRQMLRLEADINQTFYTQIYIQDDLKDTINVDQQKFEGPDLE